MVATKHDKPGSVQDTDNLILVSSDTHIGPLLSQLREYCPKKYLEPFDEFAASKSAEIQSTMEQGRLAFEAATAGKGLTYTQMEEIAASGAGMAGPSADRGAEIAARMGNAMPDAQMVGALQILANRLSEGHHDMATRLRDMNNDGLACEIIFHGSQNGEPIPFITPHDLPAGLTTPYTFEGLDLDLAYAGMHMYNQWLADQVSIEPERHVGLAYIPAWDPALSVKEVEWAREAGVKGINMPAWRPGMPVFWDDAWEPFWAASASLGMPLTNHGGAGDERFWGWGKNQMASSGMRFMEAKFHSQRLIWSLFFFGAFDRYPNLKLMISEIPGKWWTQLMEEMDSVTGMHGQPNRATEVCSEHVFHGATFMSRDEADHAYRHGYHTNVVWGSDYPHVEGTWQLPLDDSSEPQTHLSLRDTFSGLPGDVIQDMVGLNGIRVYDLDHDKLQQVANRICAPTLDEVATPLDPADVPTSHGLFVFRTVGPWS